MDPTKLKSTDEITANAARLIVAAKRFLSPILDSSNSLPLYVIVFFLFINNIFLTFIIFIILVIIKQI